MAQGAFLLLPWARPSAHRHAYTRAPPPPAGRYTPHSAAGKLRHRRAVGIRLEPGEASRPDTSRVVLTVTSRWGSLPISELGSEMLRGQPRGVEPVPSQGVCLQSWAPRPLSTPPGAGAMSRAAPQHEEGLSSKPVLDLPQG